MAPLIIWSEIEVNVAIVLSCAAAFKALAQSLFPGFMDGLMTGSTGKTRSKSCTAATHNAYVLQPSRNRSIVQRTTTEATSGTQHYGSGESQGGSREHIMDDGTAGGAVGWLRMETTISVHSSKRNSADDAPAVVQKGQSDHSMSPSFLFTR